MKKLMNIAFMAILAISFASCEKEQSSFEVSDIKTTANIKGIILHNLGQDYSNGKYIENIVPAANKKVYVEIKNSQLAPNSQKGVTIFETTTNSKGEYSLNVPVVYGGTEVTVKAEQFIGTYKEVADVDNNIPIFEEKEGIYNITNKTFTLNPKDIKFCDAVYVIDYRTPDERCKYNSTFIVKVGQPQYSIDKQNIAGVETEFISRKYVKAANIDVIVTINNTSYGATTDYNGEATFIIPAEKEKWTANIQMETTPYIVNGFNYIKSENVEKEDVWGNISYIKEFKAYKIESGIMSFYKKDLNSISFSGIADDKTPVVNAAIGFDAHNDVDAYGYDKNNEWYNVELKF